jgi:hypothetical protein
LKKINLYFHTLRYLRPRQIFFQIYYRIRKKITSHHRIGNDVPSVRPLSLIASIPSYTSFENGEFCFLNLKKKFEGEIDWNFNGFGKLWAYNLNYFEYLFQPGCSEVEALSLIESFCAHPEKRSEGMEPYPISLRGINWIKFFSTHKIIEKKFNRVLYHHYKILASAPEYHLLGNHLLENGFSLLFGAYYFQDENLYKKASLILRQELKEQILKDGAHFELSPMYHQILLFRLLDCINVMGNNSWKHDELETLLSEKASLMLGWLEQISFSNGDAPQVNDSTNGIAPAAKALFDYADRLNIKHTTKPLSDSGYRMLRTNGVELFIDAGNIGPDYIPGHAHSDTLNFIVYNNGRPLIVDTGISTYEANTKRLAERATAAHNTVMINGKDQTEVWSSFRVGRRAKIIKVREQANEITASHNGYASLGIIHERTFKIDQGKIAINDIITGATATDLGESNFHFHPSVSFNAFEGMIESDDFTMRFINHQSMRIEEYQYALGFNKTTPAKVIRLYFNASMKVSIEFKV